MGTSSTIWVFLFIGSFLGGLVPEIWGDSMLSFSSIFFSAVGAIIGIWIGYKISNS